MNVGVNVQTHTPQVQVTPKNVTPVNVTPINVPNNPPQNQGGELDNLLSQLDNSIKTPMNLDDIRGYSKVEDIDRTMTKLGYIKSAVRPTGPVIDVDGNTASNFKFMGTATAVLGKTHTITVCPLNDSDEKAPLYNYSKYLTMIATNLNDGQNIQMYTKDNKDMTYDYAFIPQELGQVYMELLLCGSLLFELTVTVESITALDWIAKPTNAAVGEPFKIEVVPKEADSLHLNGPLPFKVDAQGNIQNLEITGNQDGTCTITAVPIASGRIQFTISLYDQHINNSPLNIFVTQKGGGQKPQLTPHTGQASFGSPTVNVKPMPNYGSGINPGSGVMNLSPVNSGSMMQAPTPVNHGGHNVMSVTPMNHTNPTPNTGNVVNMTPMNPSLNRNSVVGLNPINPMNPMISQPNVVNVTAMNPSLNRNSVVGLNPINPMNPMNVNPINVNPINVNPINPMNRFSVTGLNPINPGLNPMTSPINPLTGGSRASVTNIPGIGVLQGSIGLQGNVGVNVGSPIVRNSVTSLAGLNPGMGVNYGVQKSNVGESLDDLLMSISEPPKQTTVTTKRPQSSVDELEEMMKELQDYE